ncbi:MULTISPECIES: EscU/YscU/HrcU family type III secretion system export apparatus switch protein [unclassified Sphingomonas]|jgi:flagellar biosynthesis protein FlhB|uniref:EscU/YscU/HrcU family type III secretion system export apparatus switch protein n=1 Tax=unclassified Sphingomonas TaxID=196159 RepID=UPI000834FC98|nr:MULTISPECIES: EscU/YscU/HrcU family type III secretion system export apparatus switch protein [unclassified Sphingomonas]
MAEKNDGGDKTEKPTLKRLRDARNKGDVAKSKDFGAAIGLVMWLLLFLGAAGFIGVRIAAFADLAVARATSGDFSTSLSVVGWSAGAIVLLAAAATLLPSAVMGVAGEFFQVGALFSTEKLKPKLDTLNPVEGLKRMISLDNLFELAKTLIKALLVLGAAGIVLAGSVDEYAALAHAAAWMPFPGSGSGIAAAVLDLLRALTIQLVAWSVAIFLLVALADRLWTQHRYIKKLMMSRRDIRQEHKDNEGDPMLKAQRRQLHEEWANRNAVQASRNANVLLTNPTHLAIALDYDPADCPVPMVAAKGEGPLAAAMRKAAVEADVPIVRNVGLARRLWATAEINEIIPEAEFDAIAEIILWARRARAGDVQPIREDAE